MKNISIIEKSIFWTFAIFKVLFEVCKLGFTFSSVIKMRFFPFEIKYILVLFTTNIIILKTLISTCPKFHKLDIFFLGNVPWFFSCFGIFRIKMTFWKVKTHGSDYNKCYIWFHCYKTVKNEGRFEQSNI